MKKICLYATTLIYLFTSSYSAATEPSSAAEQQEFFKQHGYLWIKRFFSPEQVALIQDWAEAINHEAQTLLALSRETGRTPQSIFQAIPGALIVVPESKDPGQVCRTEDMLSCYPEFLSFVEGTVTRYLNYVFDEPYILFKDKLNFKWPGGGAFTPHQDFPAYENFGPSEHITAMVCIDAATLENGCLQIASNWPQAFPDLKSNSILPFVVGGPLHGSIDPEYVKHMDWIPLVVSPGDVIFFSSYIPHYSEPNQSQLPRRALFFTHNKLSEGDFRKAYYFAKRSDPDNPVFHIGTPTNARTK